MEDLYFKSGSTILQPLTSFIGMEIDKINFMACQVFAIIFGRIFFFAFDAKHTSPTVRHLIEVVIGVLMTIFCFGFQIIHLILQAVIVYLIISLLPLKTARIVAFVFSLLYLSMGHLFRMYHDYQGYTLDITGPLMIQTQKLSSLAYNLYDGEKLNQGQTLKSRRHVKHALRRQPNILEIFSYCFSFHSIMVGPFTFMSDYLRFIEGNEHEHLKSEFVNLDAPLKEMTDSEAADAYTTEKENLNTFNECRQSILCAWFPILKAILNVLIFLALMLSTAPYFPFSYILSEKYYEQGVIMRVVWVYILCFHSRLKYYAAWEIGRAANLSAGFGFSGWSKPGVPSYNVVKNFKFFDIETASSLKVILDSWNIGTTHWLREVVYDRMPKKYGTMSVFFCSAIWHGFYPGYYLCFMSAALLVNTGRICRRHLRPWFQSSWQSQRVYDAFTWVGGITGLNYCCTAFALLGLKEGFLFWKSVWFCVHVIAISLFLICPFLPKASSAPSTSSPLPIPVEDEEQKKTN